MLADVAGQHASKDIVAAAGAVADDEVDVAAAIEIRDRVLRPRRLRQQRHKRRAG